MAPISFISHPAQYSPSVEIKEAPEEVCCEILAFYSISITLHHLTILEAQSKNPCFKLPATQAERSSAAARPSSPGSPGCQ